MLQTLGVYEDGGKPGKLMIGQLERREGELKSQDIGNMLWAYQRLAKHYASLLFNLLLLFKWGHSLERQSRIVEYPLGD
jgi:hypothetical protein